MKKNPVLSTFSKHDKIGAIFLTKTLPDMADII